MKRKRKHRRLTKSQIQYIEVCLYERNTPCTASNVVLPIYLEVSVFQGSFEGGEVGKQEGGVRLFAHAKHPERVHRVAITASHRRLKLVCAHVQFCRVRGTAVTQRIFPVLSCFNDSAVSWHGR
jgi:hypothetical protein